MHFNFDWTATQVLWTLTFAALLVLLMVLLGRERVRRFPWFTTSIALMALRLLAERLLFERLPRLTLNEIFLALADLMALVSLLVLLEVARRAFSGVRRRTWIGWTLAGAAVAAWVLYAWGQWPDWKTLTADSTVAVLRLMQLTAQKGDLLAGVLAVELGLLVVLFGRRYKGGWRSHTQRIMIGLSTAALTQLAVQGVLQAIIKTAQAHPLGRPEYERIIGLVDKLQNANRVVYVAVLVWWIVCLWMDEPGAAAVAAAQAEIPDETARPDR
ncbi:MAG: hypothetical protein ABSC88_12710 [Terracidiphilus sp.]|jgi:hypothetical protein